MIGNVKVILIAPDEDIRIELDKNNIEYTICIPDKTCKENIIIVLLIEETLKNLLILELIILIIE